LQLSVRRAVSDHARVERPKGYGLVGARITLRRRDRHWSIALFGTNLADVRYRTAGRGTLINQVGFAYSSVGMPRQVGLQMSSEF
ncbi:MAG: hypothetical protein ACJ8FE_00385, partial [Sphingomicrobium sp.]